MSYQSLLGRLSKVAEEYLEKISKGARIEEFKTEFKRRLQRELKGLSCSKWQERLVEERLADIVEGEASLGRRIVAVEAVLDIHGLIGASSGVLSAALEVGLTWDYVLDLPLIPGSALKGAFRSLILANCVKLDNSSKKLECLENLVKLTGWVEKPRIGETHEIASLLGLNVESVEDIARRAYGASLLVFHDTHLLCNDRGRLLEPWVITPHYKDARTEYDASPTPIEHVVLAPGLRGVFVAAVEEEAMTALSRLSRLLRVEDCNGSSCLGFLGQFIAATLASGIGARTSRGYTSFRPIKMLVKAR